MTQINEWNPSHGRTRSYAVMIIPKNASNSIERVLPVFTGQPEVQSMAFIRDPMERLKSGFMNLVIQNARTWTTEQWESHIDRVLSEPPDVHWVSQVKFLEGVDVSRYYLFEDFPKIWRRLQMPVIPHLNRSISQGVFTDYREADLRSHFGDDYALRESLT